MRVALVCLLLAAPAAAQSGSADRVAQQPDPVPRSGLLVKSLRLLEPAKPGRQTRKEKLHDYLMAVGGPVPVFAAAGSAGIGQAINSPVEWGQGASGYAKRFANDLAYNGVRWTLAYTTAPLFHEDIRYFASGKTGVKGRVAHALLSPVLARKEDGREVFSYSGATGIVGASLISRAWSPDSWQHGGNIGKSIAWTYLGTAGLNVFREFTPDLIRALQHRK